MHLLKPLFLFLPLLFSFKFQLCFDFSHPLNSSMVSESCSNSDLSLIYSPQEQALFCKDQGCSLGKRGTFHTNGVIPIGDSFAVLAWILTYEEPTVNPASILELESVDRNIALFRGIFPEIYEVTHVNKTESLKAKDSTLKSTLVWHFVFIRALGGQQLVEAGLFNNEEINYGLVKIGLKSEIFGKSQAQEIQNYTLRINHNERGKEWNGVFNYLKIIQGEVQDADLLRQIAGHSYPLIFFKGNFIQNQAILDLQFRNSTLINYTPESSLQVRVDSRSQITENGISGSGNELFEIRGFTSEGPLYLQSWFMINEQHSFTAYSFSFYGSLEVGEAQATLQVEQKSVSIRISQVKGKWHFVNIESYYIAPRRSGSGGNNQIYFSYDSIQSDIIVSQTSLRSLKVEVGKGFKGIMNRFKLSFSPRGRNSLLYFGVNTPLCSRDSFYNGIQCIQCTNDCALCPSTSSTACLLSSPHLSLVRLCPERTNFVSDQGYCQPQPLSNCAKSVSSFTCEQCKIGYELKNNQCQPYVPLNVYLNGSNLLVFEYPQIVLLNSSFKTQLLKDIQISFSRDLQYKKLV